MNHQRFARKCDSNKKMYNLCYQNFIDTQRKKTSKVLVRYLVHISLKFLAKALGPWVTAALTKALGPCPSAAPTKVLALGLRDTNLTKQTKISHLQPFLQP